MSHYREANQLKRQLNKQIKLINKGKSYDVTDVPRFDFLVLARHIVYSRKQDQEINYDVKEDNGREILIGKDIPLITNIVPIFNAVKEKINVEMAEKADNVVKLADFRKRQKIQL